MASGFEGYGSMCNRSRSSTERSEGTSHTSFEFSDNPISLSAAVARDRTALYPSTSELQTPPRKMQRFPSSPGVGFHSLPPTPDSLQSTPGFSLGLSRKRGSPSLEIPSGGEGERSGDKEEEGEEESEEGSIVEGEEGVAGYEDEQWEDVDELDDDSPFESEYEDGLTASEDGYAMGFDSGAEDSISSSSTDEATSEGTFTPKMRAKLEASASPEKSPSTLFPFPSSFSIASTSIADFSTLPSPHDFPSLRLDEYSSIAPNKYFSSRKLSHDNLFVTMEKISDSEISDISRLASAGIDISSRDTSMSTTHSPKASDLLDIAPAEYAKECIKAAFNSRLSPYNLHEGEYKTLHTHLNHMHVTSYLNIRNGILRRWLKNPRVRLTRDDAASCAKEARFLGLAEVAFDWLNRHGYINHGCIKASKPASRNPHATRRKRKIAVIGAGIAGLTTARQLEGLLAQNGEKSTGADAPEVVVFEGRKRLGGRVYSHTLSGADSDLPHGLKAAIDVGGQIVMGYEGNPLAALIQDQLEIPYHAIDNTTAFPLYDFDGKMINDGRDLIMQEIHDDILDRLSAFKSKPLLTLTAEGDRDKINACKNPRGDGGEPMAITQGQSGMELIETIQETTTKLPSSKVIRKRIGKRKASNLSDAAIAPPTKKIKLIAKKSNKEMLKKLDIEPQKVCDENGFGSLGRSMDKMFPSYTQVLEQDSRDLRLYNWYHANLEYCNASAVDKPSLENWDQDDGNEFTGAHSMIVGGYSQLAKGLYSQPWKLDVRTKHEVTEIKYGSGDNSKGVTLKFRDGSKFSADKVIVTLPLGVLKKQGVKFDPPLSGAKRSAIDKLGFGLLNKVIMIYEEPFWDTTKDGFGCLRQPEGDESSLSSYEKKRGRFYMWWNASKVVGRPTLVGLMVGDAAEQVENESDDELVEEATGILKNCFGDDKVPSEPDQSIVTRWRSDPFACGTYSYIAAGSTGADYDVIAEPIDNQIFFAGEHTNRHYPATVHGAYISGLRAAGEVVDAINGPLTIPAPLILPCTRRSHKGVSTNHTELPAGSGANLPTIDTLGASKVTKRRTRAAAVAIQPIENVKPVKRKRKAEEKPERAGRKKARVPTPLEAPDTGIQKSAKRKRKAKDIPEEADSKKSRLALEEEEYERLLEESIGPMPKKPQKAIANPYLIYQKAHFPIAKAKANGDKQRSTKNPKAVADRDEVRAVLGQMWRDEPEDVKAPYIERTDKNKVSNRKIEEKHKEAMKTWEQKRKEFTANKPQVSSLEASVEGNTQQQGNLPSEDAALS
ncbi:hypothetical protein DRE_06068 [Drechslerella stenobrocha 248]|uniref:SWIRM domain-containing protein n=1 Tax=Drechslerella stenobrocha 248 TaxID=1043628 RepID=W7I849_9PEZI|nr:hypothetical protein DRE_06068 [Drechslerella stenobrocha 248]